MLKPFRSLPFNDKRQLPDIDNLRPFCLWWASLNMKQPQFPWGEWPAEYHQGYLEYINVLMAIYGIFNTIVLEIP